MAHRAPGWSAGLLVAMGLLCFMGASPAQKRPLVKGGRAEAVIVVGRDADDFHRWVASEVQRYLKRLSGAELPIVTSDKLPPEKPLIVVGEPKTNPLVAVADRDRKVIAGLKPDGFVLKSVELEGRPGILVAGNDEPGTMYAAYEFLERLGIVFQLTNDIIPQQKPDLALPVLDVRMEPALKHRGMHCCHGIRWYMGLDDFRKEIDQLAKLKLNCLHFCWGMGGPWAKFSYAGKVAEILYPKESGYVAWTWNSGTASSVKVGRECFPPDGYLGPPEFAKVKTPEEAFTTAREFLREIIRYAHSRKVQVWVAMGEMTYVPPNLVPPGTPTNLGFGPFYCGIAIPHGDPAMLDIWEAAVRSMIESYPEADRYWVVTGSEAHIAAADPRTQALIRPYAQLRRLLPQKAPAAVDTDLADVAAADKLVRRIRARFPEAKLGAELIFRGGQLRALDAVLPKDVWLMNMVNWDGETAMSDFDGIQGRERIVWPRITDDGGELNIQLNAMMYDQEATISGTARNGITGVLGQLNKARGAEQSAQYIAEGAWKPEIRCLPFYDGYVRRLYGPDVQGTLVKAFLLLEENEKTLGWHGRRGLFGTYHHGNGMGVALRQATFQEGKPKIDRPGVEKAVQTAEEERKFWNGRAAHCRQALERMRQARPQVLPGSREELDYVIYKTENFVTVLEELAAVNEAKAAFDRALLAMSDGNADQAAKQFDQTRTALGRANELVREAARQMIPYARIPTERHILYLFNDAIPSHEATERYLAEVVAMHKKARGEKR